MSHASISEIRDPLQYYLPSHISLCTLDDGLIVLNQKSRRYFSLPGECATALAAVSAEWRACGTYSPEPNMVERDITATLATLVKRGILTCDPKLGRPIQPLRIGVSEGIDFGWGAEEHVTLRPLNVASFFVALLRAMISLYLIPFHRVVTRIRRRRDRFHSESDGRGLETVKDLVIQFRRLRPLAYSSRGACLFDSLVLLEFLALHSVYPTWVLGVRSRPFLAHSWVQYDRCVLNGTVEYVEQFTPILIV